MADQQEPTQRLKLPEVLPVLPLRGTVVFPFIIMPLSVSREKSKAAVDAALVDHRTIFLVAQKDKDAEDPGVDDLHEVGTAAVIMRMLKLPDNRIRILVQGITRAKIKQVKRKKPFLQASITKLEESDFSEDSLREGRTSGLWKSHGRFRGSWW